MALDRDTLLRGDEAQRQLARTFVRVESGFYEGLEWPLDRASTVIGRGRTADLVLSEVTILWRKTAAPGKPAMYQPAIRRMFRTA